MKDRRMNISTQKEKRNQLRRHATAAEATLWKLLKGKSIKELKFRRQHGVGPYILDFYCPEIKLCIELDGEVHTNTKEYDEIRTEYLKKIAGIQVLRFENRVVFQNPESILMEIELAKQGHQPPPPTGTPPF